MQEIEAGKLKIPIMGQFTPQIKTNKQKDSNTKAHKKN